MLAIPIDSLTAAAASGLGKAVQSLHSVAASGIRIAPTIVCINEVAQQFDCTGMIESSVVDHIADCCSRIMPDAARLCLRYSCQNDLIGLEEPITANMTMSDISNGLNFLLRTWRSDRTQSHILTQRWNRDDCFPSVVIQPYYEDLWSLVSRDASSGEPLSHDSARYNIHNVSPPNDDHPIEFAHSVERAVRYPVKVCYTHNESRAVVSAHPQLIRSDAMFIAYNDMLHNSIINDTDFISMMQPSALVECVAYQLDTPPELVCRGISSGFFGAILGQIAFPNTTSSLTGRILACRESHPKLLKSVVQASGIICLLGGSSSHMATLCRQLRKPYIGGAGGSLDQIARIWRLDSGAVVREGEFALLDTARGVVSFSGSENVTEKVVAKRSAANLLRQLDKWAKKFDSLDEFSKLSFEHQAKFSRLKAVMNSVGLQ